jgi:glyoxylase-like metal-dependent hydrolase (beta-lactamase superfamily II)/ferredoxin
MANIKKRLDTNVAGNFYVDATCINCDTCRQLAPGSFREVGEYSAVVEQPVGNLRLHQAYQALLACPVGSIGTIRPERGRMAEARRSFPLQLAEGVFYAGFNSDKSFGANSFFIQHPDGNWLVDSPRYLKQLADSFEQAGGVSYIFLTHEDDIADAAKYAKHFGAKRLIHQADRHAVPDAEWVLAGDGLMPVSPEFVVIPVPGHTPGSMALLYRRQFLFTGDHLWWDPESRTLEAPRQLVWSEADLIESIAKLLTVPFQWVLAGHGDRVYLPAEEMQAQVRALLERRGATVRPALNA